MLALNTSVDDVLQSIDITALLYCLRLIDHLYLDVIVKFVSAREVTH